MKTWMNGECTIGLKMDLKKGMAARDGYEGR